MMNEREVRINSLAMFLYATGASFSQEEIERLLSGDQDKDGMRQIPDDGSRDTRTWTQEEGLQQLQYIALAGGISQETVKRIMARARRE